MTTSLPTFAAVQTALVELELGIDADELHGSLCGYLSAGGRCAAPSWPMQLALDDVPIRQLQPDAPLGQLYIASQAQLDDEALGLALLLPAGDALEPRAHALLAWCRGFLGGFGLAAGQTRSDDAAEALADLARIAQTELSFEDPEQDAQSLEELIEFVRVAVLLLRDDALPDATATRH